MVSFGPDGKPMTVRYLTLTAMLLNELQKQDRQLHNQTVENQRQARQIQYLTEQSEQQAAQNRRLSAQVAQLKGMFEQAMATQKGTHTVAAAFDR